MTLRVVVVDDEAVVRAQLRAFIDEVDWLAHDGEAADGPNAVAMIDERRPDLVFLDVRLPGLSGIEVLERVVHQPAVAFTTAFDEYAIRALRLGALDYLLKPFGRLRFLEMAARIRERIHVLPREGARLPPRLFVRARNDLVPVNLSLVERIEAADDYVVFHHDGAEHLAHIALGDLERQLDPQQFVRVHRSHIVNLGHVAALRDHDARRLIVVMRDGSTIVASRQGTRTLRSLVR